MGWYDGLRREFNNYIYIIFASRIITSNEWKKSLKDTKKNLVNDEISNIVIYTIENKL